MGQARYVLIGLFAEAAFPAAVRAQTATRSFEDLLNALKVGQSVVVTDNTGQKTTGTVAEMHASSLVLHVSPTTDHPQSTRTFVDGAVTTIARRDSLWNGALIGLGAGTVAAWGFLRGNCGPAGYDPECSAIVGPIGVVVFMPAGAVAAALIDRVIGNEVVYRSSLQTARPSVAVMPRFAGSTRGVAVSVRF